MISLQQIRDKLVQVEGYIRIDDANEYVRNRGTVANTNNLAGLPLSHYNCGGTCSWTCSGGCSYGAGNR